MNMSEDDSDSGAQEKDPKAELRALLARLISEHRRLDDEIIALRENGTVDMLKIRRMKKVKLMLKDKIALIEDKLMPDIIA